jgi:hypothetical protein
VKVKEVIVLYEAAEDLELGREFYNERDYGIGNYFIDCLLSDIASLRLYAGTHFKQFGYFRMMSKRFPFAVYYDIENQIARVVAVLDMRMHPDTIRKALSDRKH